MGHLTGWGVEGALPRSLVVCFLFPEYLTTVWPPQRPVGASEFSWMKWGLHVFLSVLWFHGSLKLFLKLRKKNQVTTENRFQSLLGCKMGTETEPGIEKEFKESSEKRHLWYWIDKGSMAIQVSVELELPKNKRWIIGEIGGRREKLCSETFENKWPRASPGWGELLGKYGG